MSFHSFFWIGVKFEDCPEGEALKVLMLPNVEDSNEINALNVLLRSPSIPAQCIALDHICYIESKKRWGQVKQYDTLHEITKRKIMDQLDAPPYVRVETDANPRVGANHASAFHAMWVLGHVDAMRVERALKMNTDPNVLWDGIIAAEAALYDESEPYFPLIKLLKGYVNDQTLSSELQAKSAHAIGSVAGDAFDSYLMEIAQCTRPEVSAAAARCLAEKNIKKYEEFLRSVVSTWSTDYISYDAVEVRDALDLNRE